jgi:hypothetical protein
VATRETISSPISFRCVSIEEEPTLIPFQRSWYVSVSGTGGAAKEGVAVTMINKKDVRRLWVGVNGMLHVALTLKYEP